MLSKRKVWLAGPIHGKFLERFLSDESREKLKLLGAAGGTPVNLLAEELISQGYEVVIFNLDPKVNGRLVLEGPKLKILVGLYYRAHHHYDFCWRDSETIKAMILEEAPDFVHAHWAYEYALGALKSNIPCLITAHDGPWEALKHTNWRGIPGWLMRGMVSQFVALNAKKMSGVSPWVKKYFKTKMHFTGQMRVIPNGMPEWVFQKQLNSKAFVIDKAVIGSVFNGGWAGHRNGLNGLRAFSILKKEFPHLSWKVWGDGVQPGGPFENCAKQNGLESGVVFSGREDHAVLLERMAKEVDLVLNPSFQEACSMVILEALALGKPVVAGAKTGGVAWQLDGGKSGILVDVSCPAAMANGLKSIITCPEKLQLYSEKGRQRALENFHIKVVAQKYLEFYRDL